MWRSVGEGFGKKFVWGRIFGKKQVWEVFLCARNECGGGFLQETSVEESFRKWHKQTNKQTNRQTQGLLNIDFQLPVPDKLDLVTALRLFTFLFF